MALLDLTDRTERGRSMMLEEVKAKRFAGWRVIHGKAQKRTAGLGSEANVMDRGGLRLVQTPGVRIRGKWSERTGIWRLAVACLGAISAMTKSHWFSH